MSAPTRSERIEAAARAISGRHFDFCGWTRLGSVSECQCGMTQLDAALVSPDAPEPELLARAVADREAHPEKYYRIDPPAAPAPEPEKGGEPRACFIMAGEGEARLRERLVQLRGEACPHCGFYKRDCDTCLLALFASEREGLEREKREAEQRGAERMRERAVAATIAFARRCDDFTTEHFCETFGCSSFSELAGQIRALVSEEPGEGRKK